MLSKKTWMRTHTGPGKGLVIGLAMLVIAAGAGGAGGAIASVPMPDKKPPHTIRISQSAKSGIPRKAETESLLHYGTPGLPRAKPMPKGTEPLSRADIVLYRKIFALQSTGDIAGADRLLDQLGDFRLRGHVLYQRYLHPTAYRSSFEELRNWMDLYADYPGASKIYKLALSRKPKTYTGRVRAPETGKTLRGWLEAHASRSQDYSSERTRTKAQSREVAALEKKVKVKIRKGSADAAWQLVKDAPAGLLDDVESDRLSAQIAAAYMYEGELDTALAIAGRSIRRSGVQVPEAGWVAGLLYWRRGAYALAADRFEMAAKSPYASGWTRTAAAFWASRAHMQSKNFHAMETWMEEAAKYPRTFYGLIATRALGRDLGLDLTLPEFSDRYMKRLVSLPAGFRAVSLVEAGQFHLAESELKQINPGNDRELQEALLAYTEEVGLPSLAMRLANALPNPNGGLYDGALYPLLPWEPKDGYTIDRALIHAIIRQESRFNPDAESRSGATGLMQLMPTTASYVAGDRRLKQKSGRHLLKDPVRNIDIGQEYLESLLAMDSVGDDLFSLTVAYNAGPGNLNRWKRQLGSVTEDPLLFIESIPVAETRAYVEKVLANFWIYRHRLGQPTPSLEAIAKGNRARYAALDDDETALRLASTR